MKTTSIADTLARLIFVALLVISTVIETVGQCRVDAYSQIADAPERAGTTDILPGLNGDIYLLIQRGGPDTLSNGAFSDTRGHFLFKYNNAFELQWWRDVRSPGTVSMDLDSNGKLLLSGVEGIIGTDTLSPAGLPFIVRLDGDGSIGTVLSIRGVGPLYSSGNYTRLAVSREFIYFVGRRLDTLGIAVVKMDYDGNSIWTRYGETGLNGTGISDIHDIAVDSIGNVYVAGEYQREVVFGSDTLRSNPLRVGSNDIAFFIVRWNVDGEYQWSVNRIRMAGSDLGDWSFQFLAVGDDNLYVTSYDPEGAHFIWGSDTVRAGPMFLANINLDGEIRWIHSYNFSPPGGRDDFDIEMGASGSVIFTVSGWIRSGVFRYTDRDSLIVDPRGHVILRHDSEGNVICAKNFPNAAFSRIGADRNGTVYMGGMFGEYTVFNGTDTVRSTVLPRRTMYLARFGSETVRAPLEPGRTASLGVYPNPASGTVTVALPEGASGTVELRLSDMLGSVVYTSHEPAGQATVQIPVGALSSGTYLLRLTAGGKVYQESVLIAR